MIELAFIGHLYHGGYWLLLRNGKEIDRHAVRYLLVKGRLGDVRTLAGEPVRLTDRATEVWRTA